MIIVCFPAFKFILPGWCGEAGVRRKVVMQPARRNCESVYAELLRRQGIYAAIFEPVELLIANVQSCIIKFKMLALSTFLLASLVATSRVQAHATFQDLWVNGGESHAYASWLIMLTGLGQSSGQIDHLRTSSSKQQSCYEVRHLSVITCHPMSSSYCDCSVSTPVRR